MKIDKRLNIVFTLERDTGPIHVHSTPISRETFERYFIPISKTFAAIYGEGLNVIAGPRIAALMLRKVAEQTNTLEGPEGVRSGLLGEIIRLSNVLMPNPAGGWQTTPLHNAIAQEFLDEDDVAEVEGVLVFFTCVSSMHTRSQIADILKMMQLWGVQTTSSNSTEFAASLQTSNPEENTGVTPNTLSLPH